LPAKCQFCGKIGLDQVGPTGKDWGSQLYTAGHVAHNVRRLSRANLPVDTGDLARYLIGKTIVRKMRGNRISGRIVETEQAAGISDELLTVRWAT
jgi:hypothetical protein